MRVTVDPKDNLLINIGDLLEHMSPEALVNIAELVSIQDAVIKNVADQILTGWTEQDSHGCKGCHAWEANTPLDKAIREVATRSSRVAEDFIVRLEKKCTDLYKETTDLQQKVWQLDKDVDDWKVKCQSAVKDSWEWQKDFVTAQKEVNLLRRTLDDREAQDKAAKDAKVPIYGMQCCRNNEVC